MSLPAGPVPLHVESCYVAACWSSATPCRELLCRCSCNIYVCWPNTAAVQTCLLVECCCKMDASWTVVTQSACLLTFCHSILHVCWRCASLSAIPACMESHYQPYLLVWCPTISRACWRGASLQIMPFGLVLHYRPCLLVLCLTIGHAVWRDASLLAMYASVVPHYRPCMLPWYFTIGHAFWSVLRFNRLSEEGRGMATSLVLLLQRCHNVRDVCWSGATFRFACLYNATLSDKHAGFIYSDARVCKVLLHQARNLVCYKSTRHAYR